MPQDILLTEIFALRPSSVTASFQIANTQTRVIFKANRVPLFFKSAHVHLQLQECCPQAVPKLIHHQIDTSGLWMLFDPIIGKSVQDLGNHSGLIQMAKTIANIQIAFAKHLKSQTADLPRFQHQIPEMLDFLVKRIQDCYLPLWTKQGGAILKRRQKERLIKISSNVVQQLKSASQKITSWTTELQAGNWPDSICHTDLHPGNAILENNNLRIIDWDQSVVGFPFDAIYWLDTIATEEKWSKDETETLSVKETYLKTIPWNSYEDRLRAWELGERIGRINACYESEIRNDALHRKNRQGGNIASLLINALAHWNTIQE